MGGRCTFTPAGQVAELAVRAAVGLRDADALTVDAAGTVTARDGRRWTVEVHSDTVAARPPSCGADPTPSVTLRAGRVRRA